MPRTLLLIGTRKGLFVLESDGDRRDCDSAAAALRELAGLPRDPRLIVRPRVRGRGERVA